MASGKSSGDRSLQRTTDDYKNYGFTDNQRNVKEMIFKKELAGSEKRQRCV
jgi:hypothetical protein